MIIQNAPDYTLLKSSLNEDLLEIVEYSVGLYESGIVSSNNGNLTVTDYSEVDMVKLDLDAVRWWTGKISVDEYIKSIAMYYKRGA